MGEGVVAVTIIRSMAVVVVAVPAGLVVEGPIKDASSRDTSFCFFSYCR